MPTFKQKEDHIFAFLIYKQGDENGLTQPNKNQKPQGVPLQRGTTPTFDRTLRCKPVSQILHLIPELFSPLSGFHSVQGQTVRKLKWHHSWHQDSFLKLVVLRILKQMYFKVQVLAHTVNCNPRGVLKSSPMLLTTRKLDPKFLHPQQWI